MPSRPDRLVRLDVGDVSLVIDLDEGARAQSWTVGGIELLAAYGADPVQHGMYPMAPWAGRLRGNLVRWDGVDHDLPVTTPPWALHGTALTGSAEIREFGAETDRARLVARLETHPGWPWPMAVDVTWELSERVLWTEIAVHALADPFPAVVGWHPWFRRDVGVGGPLVWTMPAVSRLVRGDDHLPTGDIVAFSASDGPFDDAFLVPDGTAQVRWPGALTIDIASDAPWFVVFDELPTCACIEPQSGPPDGLHDGYGRSATVAAPQAPHRLRTTWVMRDDPPADRA